MLLDNRYFILKTDHMNLTYFNVAFTGKVLRWKLYLQDKNFDLYHVPHTLLLLFILIVVYVLVHIFRTPLIP